jgi:dolichol-phosphate mannosyltransferase
VMDADLQHDEGLLVPMLDALRAGRADVAVASRYLYGGSNAGLSKQRSRVSRGSNALVQRLLGIDLTDPMSGHFMIRRDALEAVAPALSTQGFKILLDILATARGTLRTIELPSTFRERQHGESRLDSKIRSISPRWSPPSSPTTSFPHASSCSAWSASPASAST